MSDSEQSWPAFFGEQLNTNENRFLTACAGLYIHPEQVLEDREEELREEKAAGTVSKSVEEWTEWLNERY